MKMRKYVKLMAVLLAAVLVVCQFPTVARAADVGLGIQGMVDAQIAALGGVVSDAGANVDYQFLYGSFDGNSLSPMPKNEGDALYAGDDFASATNFVQKWQWHCDAGTDTVLKITARENMYFRSDIQGDGQFHAGWAVGSTYRFVQENAAGERKTIKEIVVTDAVQSVEASAVATHLAAGESLYIVYTAAGFSTADFCPWFTFNVETYDATLNPFYTDPAPDPDPEPDPDPTPDPDPDPTPDPDPEPAPNVDIGLGIQNMVDTQIAALGGVVNDPGAYVDYQFLYGSFANGNLSPMPKNEGDALYAGDAFDVATNFVQKWQWHCDAGTDTVLKITAQRDIYFKSEIQEGGQFHGGWALGSKYQFIQVSVSGEQRLLKTLDVKDVAQSVEVSTLVTHLAAGESLYIVYSAPGYSTADFCPWFTINAGKYDAEQNPFVAGTGTAPDPDEGPATNPTTGDSFTYLAPVAAMTAACVLFVLLRKKESFAA